VKTAEHPALLHPLVTVEQAGKQVSGGNQSWSKHWTMRVCGCGAVAMADLVLYLAKWHNGIGAPWVAELSKADIMDMEIYDTCITRLQRRYLPMLPPFGINGLTLAGGIDLYCRLHGLPYRASWGVRQSLLWTRVEQMLCLDLPVIFAVGPNVPALWQQNKLNLYHKNAAGEYRTAAQVKAHYMMITAMDTQWLTVTSWGKQYYVNKEEFLRYAKSHSSLLVSNLVWLRAV